MLFYILNKLFEVGAKLIGPPMIKGIKIENISLPNRIKIRIYRPVSEKILPVLIYYHGGGWVLGSIKTYDRILRYLCYHTKCVVIAVEYKKAPKYKFPAALDDALYAFEWALTNARYLNIDTQKLALAGDSAGGNLVAALLEMIIKNHQTRPLAIVLIYPVLDVSNESLNIIRKDKRWLVNTISLKLFKYLLKQYLGKSDNITIPSMCLLNNLSQTKHPNTLVLMADIDPLTPVAEQYIEKLLTLNTIVFSRHYSNTIHGFVNFTKFSLSAKLALDEIVTFLKVNLM